MQPPWGCSNLECAISSAALPVELGTHVGGPRET
jgi:hypothetical protein